MSNIVQFFYKCFEVVSANTPELIDEAYKLRYQVYCEEKGFEDAEQFPDGREFDEYDRRAAHSLIRHRESGVFVGVVRLVLPDSSDSGELLPAEQYCPLSSHPELAKLPRHLVAEVSRFSVSKTFRRRIAEIDSISGIYQDEVADSTRVHPRFDRRLLPHVTVGLIAALVRMCREHGIHYCYSVMEPTLLKLLGRFGIHFQSVGEPVDCRGLRVPSFFAGDDLQAMMHKRPDIWSLLGADAHSFSQSQDCRSLAVI